MAKSGDGVILLICDLEGIKSGDGCGEDWTNDVACESNTQALICNGTLWSQQPCAGSCVSFTVDDQGNNQPGSCP